MVTFFESKQLYKELDVFGFVALVATDGPRFGISRESLGCAEFGEVVQNRTLGLPVESGVLLEQDHHVVGARTELHVDYMPMLGLHYQSPHF